MGNTLNSEVCRLFFKLYLYAEGNSREKSDATTGLTQYEIQHQFSVFTQNSYSLCVFP